jgi:Ca-activated chloride channel family protein
MTWSAPHLLWLLILVPVLAAGLGWALHRRRQALLLFAEARLLTTLTPDLDVRRQQSRLGLLVIASALLLLALAGPQWGVSWQTLQQRGVDIVIALDTSRSMLAEDIKPNRLERAKLAIQDMLPQLQGDRVSLVPFAGSAFVQCPLTLDYGVFAENLRAVQVGIIPKGGTSLAAAITNGIEAFEGRHGKNAILLIITDGEDHEGQVQSAAKHAADKGIRIYTIGIGTADGELIPLTESGQNGQASQTSFLKNRHGQIVKSRLDTSTLQDIALATGGAYIYAAGQSLGLDEFYLRYISQLEGREFASTRERRFHERFQWPLGVALLLLAIEAVMSSRRQTHNEKHWFGSWRGER